MHLHKCRWYASLLYKNGIYHANLMYDLVYKVYKKYSRSFPYLPLICIPAVYKIQYIMQTQCMIFKTNILVALHICRCICRWYASLLCIKMQYITRQQQDNYNIHASFKYSYHFIISYRGHYNIHASIKVFLLFWKVF